MTKNRVPDGAAPRAVDNSGDEPLSNFSRNPTFASVLDERQRQRRQFIKGSLGVAVAAFMGTGMLACSGTGGQRRTGSEAMLGFAAIATSRADTVQVPAGYRASAFVPWGTPINGVAPAYRPDAGNTGADQEQQLGSHHDGMHFFPIDRRSDEGLLVINHEYVDPTALHPDGPSLGDTRPADEVRKEVAGHGVSVLHIVRDKHGQWQQVENSRFNRRITGATPMDIQGPARVRTSW